MSPADDKPPRPRFSRVLGAATTSPLNLGVAGAAAVAAAALGSWPLLALGGAAYAAMVAFDSSSPSFWKKVFQAPELAVKKLPSPNDVKDPSTREAVVAIVKARAELDAVLRETPAEVKGHVALALASVKELEGRAGHLVARAQDLSAYLARVDAGKVEADAERLAGKLRTSRDPETRTQLEAALAARRQQQAALADIATAKERLDANLLRIVSALEGLPPTLVRMRALDAQAMDGLMGNMNAELEAMNGELRAFEGTLKTLVEVSLT